MGWCQAFGPQIRAGCDHAMVANPDSCSCPECGALCHGKFSGCPTVWAAGPQRVTLRRPAKPTGRAHSLAIATTTTTTNGNQPTSTPAPPQAPRVLASPPDAEGHGDLRPLLNALRAELHVLSRKVDQIQPAPGDNQRATAAAEDLPDKVAAIATRALQIQHDKNLRELRALWHRIEKSQRSEPAEGALKPVTLPMLEARFEWLVNEISDRLVTLGNEIARLDKQLASGSPAGSGGAAPSDGPKDPAPSTDRENAR